MLKFKKDSIFKKLFSIKDHYKAEAFPWKPFYFFPNKNKYIVLIKKYIYNLKKL
jgi:hypothetical protein